MRGKTLLTALLASSLVIANVTAAKLAWFELPLVGGVAVPAGFVGIGAAFLLTDLLGELYGREAAHEAVNSVLVALVGAWALIYASLLMPSAPFYEEAAAFEAVLGGSATVTAAAILTLLVSQNLDVAVFHALRERVPSRVVRNVGSTAVSQLVDTALFIGLAFVVLPAVGLGGQQVGLGVAAGLVGAQYVVKLVLVALDTPFFLLVTELTGAEPAETTAA